MTIESRVIECIAKVLAQPVTVENVFSDFTGFDSLDRIDIVMELEQEFDCRIDEDSLPKFTTVRQVIDYVRDNHVQVAA